MKRFKILLLCFLTITATSCSTIKSAADEDKFIEVAKKHEYTYQNVGSSYDYADIAYSINSNDIKILFIDGKRKYDIEGIFIDECKNIIDEVSGSEYDQSALSGDNWSTLTVTSEDKYYFISLVSDTYLYAEGSLSDQSKIENFRKDLGY